MSGRPSPTMSDDLESLGGLIRDALTSIPPPTSRRLLTKAIYETLKSSHAIRTALDRQFGGPVKCRYPGCPPVDRKGKRPRKVLGYLWDLSFSRFAIPQAIEQEIPISPPGKYEILLVIESELGSAHEICRDLLKLLDARAKIRCLIYRQPTDRQRLHARMVRVMRNHAHFDPETEQFLLVGLTWRPGQLQVQAYTLSADGSQVIEIANLGKCPRVVSPRPRQ